MFDAFIRDFLYMGLSKSEYKKIRPAIDKKNYYMVRRVVFLLQISWYAMMAIPFIVPGYSVDYRIYFTLGITMSLLYVLLILFRSKISPVYFGYLVLSIIFLNGVRINLLNPDWPATSIVVFIALIPQMLLDSMWRMVLVETVLDLSGVFILYHVKSGRVFTIDVTNIICFTLLGMFFYYLRTKISARELAGQFNLKKLHEKMTSTLANLIEYRDENTGGHVERTAKLSEMLAKEARNEGKYTDILTDAFIEKLLQAAPLHDVGKLRIPDAILNKPGKLTPEEFEIMKKHAAYGGEMIDRIFSDYDDQFLYRIARNVAYYHHERWDGKGYPAGLAGEHIPLEARILALADVYDALTEKRVYRAAMPLDTALSVIRDGCGTQFDPVLTDVFLNIMSSSDALPESA